MRIWVDVPKSELALIDEAARKRAICRGEFIRQAITISLMPYRRRMNHAAFGLWSNYDQDGVAYRERMRAEW